MCKTINKPVIDVAATAAKIKANRISNGYSVREIQAIFGFEYPQAVYNWESGRDIPSIDNLVVLAAVYGISVDELIVTRTVKIEFEVKSKKTA